MRRTVWIALLIAVVATAALAYSGKLRGRVVRGDGSAIASAKVELKVGDEVRYTAWTDSRGDFYVSSPRNGRYTATVSGREFAVAIDDRGMHPSTLVVR